MASRHGETLGTSVAPGDVPEERAAYLRAEAHRLFPPYFAPIVDQTAKLFSQAIYDMHLPSYRQGRVRLLGDAATVVRPNLASGVVHAMTNAMALADALAAAESTDAGLGAWDAEQEALGERLLKVGQSVRGALQDEATDWASMTPELMERWWAAAISGQRWHWSALVRHGHKRGELAATRHGALRTPGSAANRRPACAGARRSPCAGRVMG